MEKHLQCLLFTMGLHVRSCFFRVAVVVDVVVACCAAVATAVAAVACFLYAFVPGIANDS